MNEEIKKIKVSKYELKAQKLLEYLKENHVGKENSVKAKFLSEWGEPRRVRDYVNFLRMNSHPICSSFNGYYYAKTKEELEETVQYILETKYEPTAIALKKLAKNFPNTEID